MFRCLPGSNAVLYKSVDNGTTFDAIPEVGNHVYSSLYVHQSKVFILRDYHDPLYSDDLGDTWQPWLSGVYEAFHSIDVTDSEETTILGGYVGSWNPVSCIEVFSPNFPYGLDIKDNLPDYRYNSVDNVLLFDGGIFACPSSGGLWYRDDLAVGINENEASTPASNSKLSFFPNPAKDIINIHYDGSIEIAEYQIIDYSGKLLMKGKIETGMDNFVLDVSILTDGIYLVIIRDHDQINSGKFLKTN